MSTDRSDSLDTSPSRRHTEHARATDASASRPTDGPVVVVGGGQVGRLLTRRLAADRPVHYVDDDAAAVERAARRYEATFVSDLTDRRALAAVVDADAHVVVATPRDATNLLVAQHVNSLADTAQITVVVADPRTADVYPAAVEQVCAATLLTDAVTATLATTE